MKTAHNPEGLSGAPARPQSPPFTLFLEFLENQAGVLPPEAEAIG